MPTYQYVCTDCGTDLEAVQSFSDASLTECPTCGGKLRKKFGAVGVVFKGSGFYRTDSRSDRNGGSSSAGDKSSEKPAAKAESTSAGSSDAASSSGSSGPSGSSSNGSSSGASSTASSGGAASTSKASSAA